MFKPYILHLEHWCDCAGLQSLVFCRLSTQNWNLWLCDHSKVEPMASFSGLILITWSASWLSYVVTCALNSQVVYETDLAFCTTYEDGKCANREHTQTKSRDSIRIMNYKCENAQQWCNFLVEWKEDTTCTCTAYITAISKLQTCISFTGRTYFSSGTSLEL